ncbi:hypothetical protein [Planotetraspora kaengkrachanensis]|uniref:Uncharacterized protein n=1 Tax=Planotetraspora kaengkrachanensis TaxID=575193 RepID=A0A8J3LUM2_9ACTN|nr:hypothetical protein [Planotetraspora kaengkrachanensis]GIG79433.1 hypothetical protein Pka01_25600 [Planotetraspora kaengkrachanensis]
MTDKPTPRPARTGAGKQAEPTGAEAAEAALAVPGTVPGDVSATMEAIREMGVATARAEPLTVGETAADSNVADEMTGNGVAFGELVKSVGLAVAAAQSELDKNLRETAKALSETQIDVIAVFEQQIKDDDGTMDKGEVHMQKLPLINYLMPTAYQWRRVYLEADANVQEFNSRSGFNVQQRAFSAGASVSGGFGLFGGGMNASASTSYSNTSTGVDASVSQDLAAGKLHMEATLEPRSDVQLPRPFVLQKGPRLELQVGARTDVHQDNDETKPVTAHKVAITAVLKKTDGSPNNDKNLSITISEPTLNFTSPGKTNAQGEMSVDITRKVAAPDQDQPVQALVRVSFGLVSQSAAISV